uniref:Uncharacterized protein n=1 Tax=Arundo donax TaxID=35708 RepID=A0A0A9FPA9_ARUDO
MVHRFRGCLISFQPCYWVRKSFLVKIHFDTPSKGNT